MADYLILRDSLEQAAWNALNVTEQTSALRDSSDPLYDSNKFKGKKFSVVYGGFHPVKDKIASLDRTLSGKADYQVGAIVHSGTYILKVKDMLEPGVDDINYGTMDDLDWYFTRVVPNPGAGQATNLITLVDHYGNTWFGFLTGSQAPEPLTTIIIGQYAIFNVQIQFIARDPVKRMIR